MSPSSSMPTLLLLRTERKPGVLLFAATWLWTRQNTAALADLRATLDIDATDDTIDADLRAAAEHHYDALLQWCIRTTARLEGTTVRNPAAWLTATVANLRQRQTAGDMTGLATQVAMVDDLLRAAAPEDLIDAADTVSDYTTVRATIMADVADTKTSKSSDFLRYSIAHFRAKWLQRSRGCRAITTAITCARTNP